MRYASCGSLLVFTLLAPTAAAAQKTDCRGLKLKTATGVPAGATHTYEFHGTCLLTRFGYSETQFTRAEAEWNSATGAFHERLVTEGKYAGTIEMWLNCDSDPVVLSGTCRRVGYENHTGWSGFDGAWGQHRPATRGKTTLAEATLASKHSPAANPPGGSGSPLPALPDTPKEDHSQVFEAVAPTITIEAELLIPGAQVTHGQVGRQSMTRFGTQWGANTQLFWSVNQVGAQLRLEPLVPKAGRYEVIIAFTKAPDYALFKVSFDGMTETTINGYGATVTRDRGFVGMFDLAAGRHELLLSIAGRDPKSSALFVGIDRIEFQLAR